MATPSSAIIIAQTKSGTNRFQGEAFGTYTNQHLRAKRQPKNRRPSKAKRACRARNMASPLAARSSRTSRTSSSPGSTRAWRTRDRLPRAAACRRVRRWHCCLRRCEPIRPGHQPVHRKPLFRKIDVEPSENDRIEVTGNLRIEHNFSGGNGQTRRIDRVPYKNNDKRADVRWQHSGNNW